MGNTQAEGAITSELVDPQIGIPSYQRKGGKWNEGKGMKKILFCVSLLSNYPIGSVVLQRDTKSDETFLMDGQQRRETLTEISKIRPFLFILDDYFTKAHTNWDVKLQELLLVDFFQIKKKGEVYEGDFDPISRDGIQRLVQLRECYGVRKVKDGHPIYTLESKILHNRIQGHPLVWDDTKKFKGEEFAEKMIANHEEPILESCDLETEDGRKRFIIRFLSILGINSFEGNDAMKRNKSKEVVIKKLATSAKEFRRAMKAVQSFNYHTMKQQIGKITFTASSDEELEYDLKNIFRLINDGGEPLTRVELLASSPRWTGEVARVTIDESVSDLITPHIDDLKPNEGVRTSKWHICAAFAIALDCLNKDQARPLETMDLFLKELPMGKQKNINVALEEGFRLRSLFSKRSVQDGAWLSLYETVADDEFFTHISELPDFAQMLQILGADPYFKQMRIWGWPLLDGLAKSTRSARDTNCVLAALLILFRRVDGLKHNSTADKKKNFTLPARLYFDKFVYSRINGLLIPAGGADETLKNELDRLLELDVHGMPTYNPKIEPNAWETLLTTVLEDGIGHTGNYTQADKAPKDGVWPSWARLLLAHIYTMRAVDGGVSFFASAGTKYHVDHIIPKQVWQDFHAGIGKVHHCHNLANLMLMDDTSNIHKNQRRLEYITEQHTKDVIARWGGIPEDKFTELSTIATTGDTNDTHSLLVETRKSLLITKFLDSREKCLTKDGKWWE